jgi:kynurenine formamidase
MIGKCTIVDLSLPIYHEMPIWSGEPKIAVTDYFRLGRNYGQEEVMNMKLLIMPGHAGTHTDAPSHWVAGAWTLDQVPLERYLGPAWVLDMTHKRAGGEDLTVADLGPHEKKITPGCRLLLHTGWDVNLGTERYFDKEALPKITPDLMRWLSEKRVALVGVDTPSVNPYPERHRVIFEAPEPPVVVELLTNLDKLPEQVFLICMPLKIREGDGSPVRAIALVPE